MIKNQTPLVLLYLRECVVVSTSYFVVRCLLVVVFCIGGFGFSVGNVTRTHAHILIFFMFYSNFILFLLFLGILHSTCVFESSFGFILDCNFRKSSLFRVRNLGGVKAHFGLGKFDALVRWIDELFVNFYHQIKACVEIKSVSQIVERVMVTSFNDACFSIG